MAEEKTIESLTKELETAQGRAVIADIYEKRASLYKIKEDYENALKDYEKALEYEPENRVRAWIHHYIAEIYEFQKNFDKAEKEYTLAIETDLSCCLHYLYRGQYYKKLWEVEKYKQDYAKAKELGYGEDEEED